MSTRAYDTIFFCCEQLSEWNIQFFHLVSLQPAPMPGCANNNMQHTQAHDDVSLMLATFDTPTYLPNRCH